MKVTMEDIIQWEQLLDMKESTFSVNRKRIRELKRLILISENPQEYENFKREEKQEINTLHCKAEMSKLVIRNDNLKREISALISNIEQAREMVGE